MKVSIIIPVYKVENLITRCIESILNQSLQDFEVILVNDCTPDNSIEVAKKVINNDNRFTFIDHPKNLGLMRARYTGYKVAKGDYFVFCDSDDALPINSIELLYNSIVNTNSDIVIANHLYVPNNGKDIKTNNKLSFGNDKISVYKSLLNRELTHNLCGKIFSSSLFKKFTYETYDNFTNSEDLLLFYQLINNVDKVSLIEDVVYLYYQNSQSSTNLRLSDKALENIIISLGYLNKLSTNYTIIKKEFNTYIIKEVLTLIVSGYNRKFVFSVLKSKGLQLIISFSNIKLYHSYYKSLYSWVLIHKIPIVLFRYYRKLKSYYRK